jgi:hypothetical protein
MVSYVRQTKASEESRQQMFTALDSQETVSLGHKLISANRAIVAAYGVDSAMNAELLSIWDELEPVADGHGVIFS